jgi:hypothetical protein
MQVSCNDAERRANIRRKVSAKPSSQCGIPIGGFEMVTRLLIALVATAALAVFTNVSLADKDAADTHSGVVVSTADGKLTMSDKDGTNEHTHDVALDAKISCDGKDCKLEDLKKGTAVKVTTKDKKAVKIEAKTAK